jgi:preprotein translocase subunit SecB
MRPSPLQLRHVVYKKVSVAPRSSEESGAPGEGFDFEGVNLRSKIGTALKEGQEDDPRDYLVDLEIVIDNNLGKPTPYEIDVGVIGIFNVLPSLPKDRREDLVTVNGASILYGVIRELVLNLTSRFPNGALTLPGMNFEDSAPSARQAQEGNREHSDKRPPRLGKATRTRVRKSKKQ